MGLVALRFSPEAGSPFAPEFLGGTSSSKDATTVVGTEADPKSGVDVVMSLGGVVAGHVTVQGTGAALAGIEVCASDWPQLSGDTCVETDTSGAFSIIGPRDLYEIGDLTRPEYIARRDAIHAELTTLTPEPLPNLDQASKVLEDFTIFGPERPTPTPSASSSASEGTSR